MPELLDENSMVMRVHAGEGSFDENWDPENGEPDFEMSSGMNGTPVIYFKHVRRYVTFSWNELLDQATKVMENEGIDVTQKG